MRGILILVLLACVIAPLAAEPSSRAQLGPSDTPVSEWDKLVNAELKDSTLDTALGVLLKDTDISYRIDPDAAKLKVTAVLKNVSRQTALLEILAAVGALMERSNNVVHIMAGELAQTTPRVPVDEGGQIQVLATRVLVINHINPAELVPILYAVGARQVTVAGENRLVVTGTAEVLDRAGDVVADVDREESLPRPVRLKLTVNVRSEQKGGEPFDCSISCDGAGAEGQMVSPNLSVKLPVGKTGDTAEVFLNSTITPTISPDGKIALRGSGSFKCTPSGEVSRTFEVAVVVQPGKSQVISEGSADVGTGKVSFSVDVLATIGEGRLRTKTGGITP